ncbi:MAG: hypothetical protein JWN30_2290 [Bacilli bacterium]|nr:hypothetical protein [Bacilli bacterium]
MVDIGFVLVEVCDSNWVSALDLEDLEQQYPGVSVLRSECLSLCEFCRESAYALVNGEIVSAATAEQCLIRIKEKIEQELALNAE